MNDGRRVTFRRVDLFFFVSTVTWFIRLRKESWEYLPANLVRVFPFCLCTIALISGSSQDLI